MRNSPILINIVRIIILGNTIGFLSPFVIISSTTLGNSTKIDSHQLDSIPVARFTVTSLAKEPSFLCIPPKIFNVGNGLKFPSEKYYGSEISLRYRKGSFSTKIRKIKKCALACGQYWKKISGKSEHFYIY